MALQHLEDLDPGEFRVLPDRSVQLLEPGDRIDRAGLVAIVEQVVTKGGKRVVHFTDAPSMDVSSPLFAGMRVTIYRPRPGVR